jgi:hypothetical protein
MDCITIPVIADTPHTHTHTHIRTILYRNYTNTYMIQIQFNLFNFPTLCMPCSKHHPTTNFWWMDRCCLSAFAIYSLHTCTQTHLFGYQSLRVCALVPCRVMLFIPYYTRVEMMKEKRVKTRSTEWKSTYTQ